jgi:hypothetical protein
VGFGGYGLIFHGAKDGDFDFRLTIKGFQIDGVKSYWLALPALRTVYVNYSPSEYEIYSGSDTMQDNNLGIELELSEIFK